MAAVPLQIAVTPDTAQFARVLRVLAEHLCAAADEIEHMASPLHLPVTPPAGSED